MLGEELKKIIETGLNGAEALIKGEGDHFEAVVISESFVGKTMVQQHQMVYGTLGDLMQGELHALALHTYTPEQWASEPRIQ